MTLRVLPDAPVTTRVSGVIRGVDGRPLAGMRVEVGGVRALTSRTGAFTLDLGGGPPASGTLKVRGELFAVKTYLFIAEKLDFLLGHDLYAGENNVICRPVFLPELDGGTAVDPAVTTTVTARDIPDASVRVEAGTLMTSLGQPFAEEG
ncbi:MAG: hypothetical protein ACRC33_31135 [Gemmataceae bacterium]